MRLRSAVLATIPSSEETMHSPSSMNFLRSCISATDRHLVNDSIIHGRRNAVNTMDRGGERGEPWGAPVVGKISESIPSILNRHFLFCMKLFIQRTAMGGMPSDTSNGINTVRGMELKNPLMSNFRSETSRFLDRASLMR